MPTTIEIGYCDYHLVTKIKYYDYFSTLILGFDRTVYITLWQRSDIVAILALSRGSHSHYPVSTLLSICMFSLQHRVGESETLTFISSKFALTLCMHGWGLGCDTCWPWCLMLKTVNANLGWENSLSVYVPLLPLLQGPRGWSGRNRNRKWVLST